ncbi:histidinol-phosphatase [Neomegalonema sp.]|uniref:histidinol-phosphatase n=1 Tax=Neomegalonema sp. TaxID=2039713 RepID=UPI002609F017|nr:histidinol-phosphatase [Neomegalonema sp.]MDD2868066.1 histidinol-phosphatase [Neomegalonema sp.]
MSFDPADLPPAPELAAMQRLAERLAEAAGAAILPSFRAEALEVEDKRLRGVFDPVTEADKAGERAIRAILEAERPEDSIWGEEYGRREGTSGYEWILDPIDGTRAFICGLAHWGILVGLYWKGRPVAGVLGQPWLGEIFSARLGGGALLTRGGESRALRTRPCGALSDAVMFTTDPRIFDSVSGERAAYDALERSVRLARYGADCYGYAMLAAGRADLVVESGLSTYDVAALIPLVREAGGVVTDWRGGDCAQGGRVIAAGDARLHALAMAGLSRLDF